MPKILGIELAPLHIPMERRLQTLAVQQWTLSFLFLGFGCLIIMIYLLFTSFYWIPLCYLVYYLYDRKTSARGGRRWQWIREWPVWKYFQQYFPITLIKTVELDPKKNYIMGFHPHGILSVSAFCHFATEGSGWSKIFPGITPYLLVLPGHFMFPVYRDYFMAGGKFTFVCKTVCNCNYQHCRFYFLCNQRHWILDNTYYVCMYDFLYMHIRVQYIYMYIHSQC